MPAELGGGRPGSRDPIDPTSPCSVQAVVRLAWPAVVSFLLANAYRINDQFWIQGLGDDAQAAIGAVFFVVVMNFAAMFLAVGGTMALVSRMVGARDPDLRDSYARHAILLALAIGIALMAGGSLAVDGIVALLGLVGAEGALAREYLVTLYLVIVPLAVSPTIDNVFIARGRTIVPMVLQIVAVSANYVFNGVLIYGPSAAERMDAPGAAAFAAIAGGLGIEAMGISGAAVATGLSRTITALLGLAILRFGFGMRLTGTRRPRLARLREIASIGLPTSVSIAAYAGVYWALFGVVLSELATDARAGLGVGFQVFEGVSFPCYLGVSVAGASLLGRALGARDRAAALAVVRSTRIVGRALGLAATALFLLLGPTLAPVFAADASVADATAVYVATLAFSQYFVAMETMNEKLLVGAGHTRPGMWIGVLGNALRIPLGWLLALELGWGALGAWWAINLSTYVKAGALHWVVERRTWLTRVLGAAPDVAGSARE